MISKMISSAVLSQGQCQLYLAYEEFMVRKHWASTKKEMESMTGYERISS